MSSDVDRSTMKAASATAVAPSSHPSASGVSVSAALAGSGDRSGTSDASEAPIAPADRPAASGHRFGPDLACSECGMQWEEHQREPAPCETETADDAFLRRPDVG